MRKIEGISMLQIFIGLTRRYGASNCYSGKFMLKNSFQIMIAHGN